MPILVIVFGKFIPSQIVILFWPTSIVLMSLGAEQKPLSQVIYVWSIAIGLNSLLYVIIGTLVYFAVKFLQS